MDVTVKLPDDFQKSLEQQILKMALDAFNVVKDQASYPEYLKLDQCAKFLNLSRSTVTQKLIPMGLPVTLLDSIQMIKKTDAIEFMEQHRIN